MNIFKSGFIHGGILITLDTYAEQNGANDLNNANSEIMQSVYADHSFHLSRAKNFSVILMVAEETTSWSAQMLSFHHINNRTNDKKSGEFSFMSRFEKKPFIDSFDSVSTFFVFDGRQKTSVTTILLKSAS